MYGSIESANIVGYAPAALQDGGLTAGAAFVPVSGKTIDLIDLKVVGYEEEGFCDGSVQVQTLNEFGQTQDTYVWFDSGDGEFYGWYMEETPLVRGKVTIQPGEGLWTYCAAPGYSLQSAGQVPMEDVAVNLLDGGLSVANPTPVKVDLSKTFVTGYEEEGFCDGSVQVQTLNEFGQTQDTYVWFDSGDGEFYGWYADEEIVVEGAVPVEPGAGLWVYAAADGYVFNWPKVNLAK